MTEMSYCEPSVCCRL